MNPHSTIVRSQPIGSPATATIMQPPLETPAMPDTRPAITATHALPRSLRARLQAILAPRFMVERELGGGATSTVFQARDVTSGRMVAVKVLADPDAEERERIRRETMVTARLRHRNVLPLIDAGEAAGLAYLVTPFVAGGSLRERLDQHGPLPAMEVVRIMHSLAAALAHAHANGVVHGDVKPENVLLDGQRVLLADFGAARLRATSRHSVGIHDGHPAAATPTMGTPLYMSPEQALGEPTPDPRSDIYSLAVVGVELLTGRPPFTGPTTRAVLLAHLREPAPSLVTRAGVPLELARLIGQSLQKLPDDRPSSAAAVMATLAALLCDPAAMPFAPGLVRAARCTAATPRSGGLAAMVSAITLGTAAFAAAVLLVVAAAAPLPGDVRVARESALAAPTTCDAAREVGAPSAAQRARA